MAVMPSQLRRQHIRTVIFDIKNTPKDTIDNYRFTLKVVLKLIEPEKKREYKE